jgi:hypothetical protein
MAVVEVARGAAGAILPAGLREITVRGVLAFSAGIAPSDGFSPVVITLAAGALKVMSTSKSKVAVLLLVVGLASTGLGWWGMGLGKNSPTVNSAAAADSHPRHRRGKAEEQDTRADLLARAKAELRRVTSESEDLDAKLTAEVIEARQRLMESEELLSTLERRKKIIRLEEDVRLLERKRARARETADRRRDALAERIGQLESSEASTGREGRSLRAVERKLDSLQRELRELRGEVQRLRSKRKK